MTTFEYLSVFISIVVGVAMVRLIRGMVEIATGQSGKPYWIHTLWMVLYLLWLPYFWWFTFGWRNQEVWTYPLFFFIVLYSMVIYAFIATLVPSDPGDVEDFEEFFYSVRRVFFGLLGGLWVLDGIDSILKGPENLERLGPLYFPIVGLGIAGNLVAAWTDSRRYHTFWVIAYFLFQTLWSMGTWASVLPSG
jgi:hypothetical protein